ncbi:MAG: HAD family hydrolase [Verrucomicrobiales bacterium]
MNIPKGEFDAYIFDHDGTLSLSMHVHFDGWIESFRKNGGNFEFTREIAQSYAGVGMHDTVKILNDRFGCEMDPEQVVIDQENYFFNNIERVKPYDPVVNFAKNCKAEGKPIAVASGGVKETVVMTMNQIGITDLFDVIVTQDDVNNSKPAPDLFLLAAKKMNIKPNKCLVFEDSQLGIEAANKAGMKSVFVQPDDPE